MIMLHRPISITIERHYETRTQENPGQITTLSASHLQLPSTQRPATPPLAKLNTTELNILPTQQIKNSISPIGLTSFFNPSLASNKPLILQDTNTAPTLLSSNPPN